MSELDMKRSSLLPSKSRPLSNIEEEPSASGNIRSNKVSPCRVSAPAPLIIGPLDPPVSSFSRIHQTRDHEPKPKPNREVGRNSFSWECPTVGSCPSCHSYQSMNDDFVSCKVPRRCHDKHQILVASLHKPDRSFQPLTTKKYLLSCNILFLFLSNHLLGSRIAIERGKHVNDLKTNV